MDIGQDSIRFEPITTEEARKLQGQHLKHGQIAGMIAGLETSSAEGDIMNRSPVLSFSFGPNGVVLENVENRTPKKTDKT